MLRFKLMSALFVGATIGFFTLSAVNAGSIAGQSSAEAEAECTCSENDDSDASSCSEQCQSACAIPSPQSANASNRSEEVDVIKISETFGHLLGRNLQSPGFTFDVEAIIRGIRDGVAGKPAPMTEDEYDQAITLVQERAFNDISVKNLQEAEVFMQLNAQNSDIVQIEPGKLQYRVLQTGTGTQVAPENVPLVHYTGKYINGTVFGSSAGSDPISLPLNQTIPGFSKGLVGMLEGEKRILYIHPELAYGTAGSLPPNSLLIFEVEIIKADSHEAIAAPEAPVSHSNP